MAMLLWPPTEVLWLDDYHSKTMLVWNGTSVHKFRQSLDVVYTKVACFRGDASQSSRSSGLVY